jgi:ComF family protein
MIAIHTYAKVIWEDFVSILFPNMCVHCKDILVSNESFICTSCRLNFPILSEPTFLSDKLQNPRISFSRGYLLFRKKGIAQSILHEVKYKGNYDLGVKIGQMFAQLVVGDILNYQVIVPVPLHPERLRKRGYNQSEAFARGVSNFTNIPIVTDVVTKHKDAKSQVYKSKVERLNDLKGAFTINSSRLNGIQSVLIMDDLVTTGSTINAIVDAFQHTDVQNIGVLSIAVGK